jgi:hypothetical protein
VRKVPAVGNILPGSLLRKLVRKAIHESESCETWLWQNRLLSGRGLNGFALIFCFGVLSGAEAGTGRCARLTAVTPAHDSLQMPVKYDDDVFQTHRQMHAVV